MKKDYKYIFSFVIPVYNVENYLAETIQSILAQTMDFETNCEIILVNDGSPDNSEAVCLQYKERFPDNISYLKQKNAGPGAARNRGINAAQGKYIGLIDSDDKYSPDTAEDVYNFFETHYDKIDLVAIKMKFFEAKIGHHPLNYKFTSDRVIDLKTQYKDILSSCAPAFFKEAVLRKHPFNPNVGRYGEDARLMGEILLENPLYGVVANPNYFYRKRNDQISSQDTAKIDRFWYLETLNRVWYDLFDYARKQCDGEVPKFIQFHIMYSLQWRYTQQAQTVLSGSEQDQYKSALRGLLHNISDEIILGQNNLSYQHKLFVLEQKNNKCVKPRVHKIGSAYFYDKIGLYDYGMKKPKVHIEIIEAIGHELSIEGYFDGLLVDDAVLQFRAGGKIFDIEPANGPTTRRTQFLGETVSETLRFKVLIPLQAGLVIEAFVAGVSEKLRIETHRFSKLSKSAGLAYRVCGGWLLRKKSYCIEVYTYRNLRRIIFELHYATLFARRLKLRVFVRQYRNWLQRRARGTKSHPKNLMWLFGPLKNIGRNIYVLAFRLMYFAVKPFIRRPIWILSDRIMAADDSGEILFRYLRNQPKLEANVYFALSKRSGEFARLLQYGKVINYGSVRYKLLFLLSSKIISSEATDGIVNAFPGCVDDFIDLYNFDFVFLQHGIIRDDISSWINRFAKNIKLLVTSVNPERDSIINGTYGYGEDVVKLTGLPRYDTLESNPKNKIIYMPTWRQQLAGKVDPKTGTKLYNPNFTRSEYYQFFQRLIDDQRIRMAMENHGFKAEFYIHPSLQNQASDFVGNNHVTIMRMPHNYVQAKCDGNLLVTDFSSVAFDFAYLKKSVIYTQFDKDTFFKLHTSKDGYFTYEKDGFGPVFTDYESTVNAIVQSIETGCKMDTKYVKRVEKFFAFNDKNNSQRVLAAILDLDTRKRDNKSL